MQNLNIQLFDLAMQVEADRVAELRFLLDVLVSDETLSEVERQDKIFQALTK